MTGYFPILLRNITEVSVFLLLNLLGVVAMRFAAKAHTRIPFFVGLVCLIGLFVPTALLVSDFSYIAPHWLAGAFSLVLFILPLLSLFIAGTLMMIGLKRGTEKPATNRWYREVCMLLGVVILAKILHNIYWLIVWDGTGDSMDFFWIIIPIVCAVAAGFGMIINLPRGRKLVGLLYLIIVPVCIIAVYLVAERVDFRALTNQRAVRVARAVEAYYERQGSYPSSLVQLPWWQRLTLPGPVILYGQDWCYQGDKDYYRLGYLDRQHWSSPILFGHVYSAKGHSPLKVDVCQPALDAYRTQYPGWDQTLQEYGQPTPTSDIDG